MVNVVTMSVIMANVVRLTVLFEGVVMLSVVMFNFVMLCHYGIYCKAECFKLFQTPSFLILFVKSALHL